MVLLSQVPTPNHIDCELTNGSALTGRAVCGSMTYQPIGGNVTINLMQELAHYVLEDRSSDENEGVRATDEWLQARELDGDELEEVLHKISQTVALDLLGTGRIDLMAIGLSLTVFKFAYELAAKQYGSARPL